MEDITLFNCFQYLEQEMLLVLLQVSRGWRRVALAPALWARVDLARLDDYYMLVLKKFEKVKPKAKEYEEEELLSDEEEEEEMRFTIKTGVKRSAFFTPVTFNAFMVKFSSTLEVLTDSRTSNFNTAIYEWFRKNDLLCPNLIDFSIGVSKCYSYLTRFIAKCCPKIQTIQVLTKNKKKDLNEFLSFISTKHVNQITTLKVGLDSDSERVPSSFMWNNLNSLTNLRLVRVALTAPSFKSIFSNLPNLNSLYLERVEFLDEKVLPYGLPSKLPIEKLELWSVDDPTIVSTILKNCPKLKSLKVNSEQITKIQYINYITQDLPELEIVHLNYPLIQEPFELFEKSHSKIRELYILQRRNNQPIEFQYLRFLEHLEVLQVNANVYYWIVATICHDCTKLKYLDIATIGSNTPQYTSELEMKKVLPGEFINLQHLSIRDAYKGDLFSIVSGACNVTKLLLPSIPNTITVWPPDLVCPKLKYLEVRILPDWLFKYLIKACVALETLYINIFRKDTLLKQAMKQLIWPKTLKTILGAPDVVEFFKSNPQIL